MATRRTFCRSIILLAGAAALPSLSLAQDRRYARRLLDDSRADLRRIWREARPDGRENERFERTSHFLADVDHDLDARGFLDKRRLDDAIGGLDEIIRVNRLAPRQRERLADDMRRLRDLRRDWRSWR